MSQISSSTGTPDVTSDASIYQSLPKGKTFQINTKKFFLTYPRCYWTPSELLSFLEIYLSTKERVIDRYLIVQEDHKDGTPHLHAIIEFTDPLVVKNPNYFDIPVEPKHGNYGSVKSYPAAVRYLTKSGTPISNWDYATYLKTQTRNGNLSADYTAVNEQAKTLGVRSLVDTGRIPMDRYGAWKRGLTEYNADLTKPVEVPSMHFKLPIKYDPPQFYELDIDLTQEGHRHFWFFGSSGTGKTWTAKHQNIPYYEIPKNNDWIGYAGQQLLILNEFKGEMTPTQLIGIMESAQQNVKGSSATLPSNTFLIVTSNYSLRDCFRNLNEANDEQLNALDRRFHQVKFSEVHPSCPTGASFIDLNALNTLVVPKRPRAPEEDVGPIKRFRVNF